MIRGWGPERMLCYTHPPNDTVSISSAMVHEVCCRANGSKLCREEHGLPVLRIYSRRSSEAHAERLHERIVSCLSGPQIACATKSYVRYP